MADPGVIPNEPGSLASPVLACWVEK